jgi:acyl carrier protein
MNASEIRNLAAHVLARIAPEVDLSAVEPGADLRDTLDLDSMDFLNFITGISQGSGHPIAEKDYPQLYTLDGLVAYLSNATRS